MYRYKKFDWCENPKESSMSLFPSTTANKAKIAVSYTEVATIFYKMCRWCT